MPRDVSRQNHNLNHWDVTRLLRTAGDGRLGGAIKRRCDFAAKIFLVFLLSFGYKHFTFPCTTPFGGGFVQELLDVRYLLICQGNYYCSIAVNIRTFT